MLANFHTHSTFCDGANSPEEIVRAAIERGFSAIGFSGHGNTPFDLRYCMTDTEGYIAEINRIKREYGEKIEIYLGIEEDAFSYVDRSRVDYIIGSSHYFYVGGEYLSLDSDGEYFARCVDAFGGDVARLAEAYYSTFCAYVKERKPDIVGHFDLITKFDEKGEDLLLSNAEHNRIAEKYIAEAAESDCIFEVNTGAMAKGYRTSPYPNEDLLSVLRKKDARIILSSDSHSIDTLDYGFEEMKSLLYDVGFRYAYTLTNGNFEKYSLR